MLSYSEHKKTRQIARIGGLFRMVGVGRIELPTPAMSTQRDRQKAAETRDIGIREMRNSLGTFPLLSRVSRKFHAKNGGRFD